MLGYMCVDDASHCMEEALTESGSERISASERPGSGHSQSRIRATLLSPLHHIGVDWSSFINKFEYNIDLHLWQCLCVYLTLLLKEPRFMPTPI